mmetsp:Transcript_16993/g.25124  ORF Transcript_16993/g.25124 Transcript_16993/m.25124 type:complete len:322 (-) Transcript_16993:107-1072(-)|eukprot:CAMPEP_0171457938 /NCGR_PEP_ID=MMETSP0945-20130129/3810_1 /TAXON_ID=109269 /ORGANISM="Vaucheria litorea, Strain CCMP2940" /LENGTH=321 /DNA_ID=CAMNT_0011983633 /DNA_START=243 /DNA_END=1208 /DNA_ORIENTATION=-
MSCVESAIHPSEITVKLPSGLKVSAKVWKASNESGQRKRVIAIHDYLDNANSFDKLGPGLAAISCEVFAVDLPGHGRSIHYSEESWNDPMHFVLTLLEFISEIYCNRFYLIGHGFGTEIILLFAACYPEMVEGLIFLDFSTETPIFKRRKNLRQLRKVFESSLRKTEPKVRVFNSMHDAASNLILHCCDSMNNAQMSMESAMTLVERSYSEVVLSDGTCVVRSNAKLQFSPFVVSSIKIETLLAFLAETVCCCLFVSSTFVQRELSEGKPFAQKIAHVLGGRMFAHERVDGGHYIHLENDTFRLVEDFCKCFITQKGSFLR